MLGGKWTTYRKMGEDMIDRVEKELGWPERKGKTENLRLHGYTVDINNNDPLAVYGSNAGHIKQKIKSDDKGWLSEPLRIHIHQVIWAIENEMARTVEDILARRTRALFLDARECRRIAPLVAQVMADTLSKDSNWINDQLEAFNKLSSAYILE